MNKMYGIPHQGSQSNVAEFIISKLPTSPVFVDLFAGGCAVTHAAMLSGKYDRFCAFDTGDAPHVFVKAMIGWYTDKTHCVSSDDLEKTEDADSYASFYCSLDNEKVENFKRNFIFLQEDYSFVTEGPGSPGSYIEDATFYYCDPPHEDTSDYFVNCDGYFDYDRFDNWLNTIDKPCIVSMSVYDEVPRCCVEIASFGIGKLFIQERYLDWYNNSMINNN